VGYCKRAESQLCYDDFGLHFFAAFLDCLRAGITPILVYPPGRSLAKSLNKMNKVVDSCSPLCILTDSKISLLRKFEMLNPLSKTCHLWPKDITFRSTDSLIEGNNNRIVNFFDVPSIDATDLAFIQYTSGSNGDLKGAMVTFKALAANIKLIHNGFDQCSYSLVCSNSLSSSFNNLANIAIFPFSLQMICLLTSLPRIPMSLFMTLKFWAGYLLSTSRR
jgi:acyl-CoA synthetase (AMP-forming)/AMP-acid ligase II